MEIKGGFGNFNLFQALWGLINGSASTQSNVNDVSTQLQSAQEENATSQVTLTQMMNFINGGPRSMRNQSESGNTETILLGKQMAELSRVINEQTSDKLETKAQTLDMGEMGIAKVADSWNFRSAGGPNVEIARRIYVRYRAGWG